MQKTLIVAILLVVSCFCVLAQDGLKLSPKQLAIEKQQERLRSTDVEERRDAVMILAGMRATAASRAALPALQDESPIVRASAARAILSIGGNESVVALTPLLNDKDEFVRREAAYALGLSHSRNATGPLSQSLLNDKEAGVRAAAALGLGEIADEAALVALAGTLAPELSAPTSSKRKREPNAFVLRAAATALGQIGSRAGTAALVSALSNDKLPSDVRRESARALGLIGDPTAAPALKAASLSPDPFLAEIAHKALRKLAKS
jgi:HEAT repeat protein